MQNSQALAHYLRTGTSQAFGELAGEYVDLVYSACLRQVGDEHLAEDVAQAVLVILFRKVRGLPGDTVLSAWLLGVCRLACRDALRREAARKQREQKAAAMKPEVFHPDESADWGQIAPYLDDALASLGRMDRSAVALRFFEQRSLREVGLALGLSEDAAQKRIGRALEKLRKVMGRKTAVPSVAGLGVAMAANGVQAAPAGVVQSISAIAISGGSGTSVVLAKGVIKMMMWAKVKVAAMVILAIGIVAGSSEIIAQSRSGDTLPAVTAPNVAKSQDKGNSPTTIPAGPKAAFQAYVEYVRNLDENNIVDCFHAETPEEKQFVRLTAENIVAFERFNRAMSSHFGPKDRYPFTYDILSKAQATERVTGERAVVEFVLATDNTISVPMRRMEGKWRIQVGEMLGLMRNAASKRGDDLAMNLTMKQISEQAQQSTPAYLRLADAVNRGFYKSADAVMEALVNDVAATNSAATTRSSR